MILSSNDLVVGLSSNIVFLPFLRMEYALGPSQCHMNTFQICLQFFSSGCSLFTLVIMSMERYVAICHPFYHRTKVTKALLMKCLAFLWIQGGFGILILPLWFQMIIRYIILPEFFLCTTLLFFFYTKIFHIANRQASMWVRQNGKPLQDKRCRSRNTKLAISCLFVVLSFMLCYFPLVMIKIIEVFQLTTNISAECGIILTEWSFAFMLFNSSLNSIVFFWRIKLLRDEAFKLIKKIMPFFIDKKQMCDACKTALYKHRENTAIKNRVHAGVVMICKHKKEWERTIKARQAIQEND